MAPQPALAPFEIDRQSGGTLQVDVFGRVFAIWASFCNLGEFLQFGRVFAIWASFCKKSLLGFAAGFNAQTAAG
jgi:hypothetical protein